MKGKMLELKNWLKDSGKRIRILKALHKKYQQAGYETAAWNSEHSKTYLDNSRSLYSLKREYRHKHIAYSELRGRTRAQIEASYPYNSQSDKSKRPDEEWIKRIKDEYLSACRQTAEGSGF